MFFVAGGKKGLPWGHLRTHEEISAAKNDDAIHDFCQNLKSKILHFLSQSHQIIPFLATEYAPIADILKYYLFFIRNRQRQFAYDTDYFHLYNLFLAVLTGLGYENDRFYDWSFFPSPPVSTTSSKSGV